MIYFATITSQGQITIPAEVRKILGLKKASKAILEIKDDLLQISPVRSITKLRGIFKEYGKINKGKTIDQIIKQEEDAVADAVVDRYFRKEKRSR